MAGRPDGAYQSDCPLGRQLLSERTLTDIVACGVMPAMQAQELEQAAAPTRRTLSHGRSEGAGAATPTADRVVSGGPVAPVPAPATAPVQRQGEEAEEEVQMLAQRQPEGPKPAEEEEELLEEGGV